MENNFEKFVSGKKDLEGLYIFREFDRKVAGYAGAATLCQEALEKNPEDATLLKDIEAAKKNFYAELDGLVEKFPEFPPRIENYMKSLEKLRRKDWSKPGNIAELKEVMGRIFYPFSTESRN